MSALPKSAGTLAKTLTACSLIFAVAACGGGGGGGVASTPPPPPPPPAPPPPPPLPPPGTPLFTSVTTSQEFAAKGASFTTPFASWSDFDPSAPSLADGSQLDVRYNAATQRYEIQLPASTSWSPIHQTASYMDSNGNEIILYRAQEPSDFGVNYHRTAANLQYSALLEWWTDSLSGFSAIGIPTPAGSVPTTGTASYTGSIVGSSSEIVSNVWDGDYYVGAVRGSINLAFNFGTGSLSGILSPTVFGESLPTLTFTNTVFSVGSTTFAGTFATPLPGVNSFSGRFTGPTAQELIGNFAFPYASLSNGSNQQAAGAFVARRP